MSATLHAKVYFSAPSYNGTGDEFYFDVPGPDGSLFKSITVRSTSWEPSPELGADAARIFFDPNVPIGGRAEISVVLSYFGKAPELIGSTLLMSTIIEWWISFPSGVITSNTWDSELTNARCSITRTIV